MPSLTKLADHLLDPMLAQRFLNPTTETSVLIVAGAVRLERADIRAVAKAVADQTPLSPQLLFGKGGAAVIENFKWLQVSGGGE